MSLDATIVLLDYHFVALHDLNIFYQADDLLADIRLREFDETGCERHDVSFEEFVMLYINHRPAHGICLSELQEAFQDIVQTADEPTRESIDKNDFIDTICSQGGCVSK